MTILLGSLRVIEYVDHLHEHFVDPVSIVRGHYVLPQKPGYSIQIRPETLEQFAYPHGERWGGVAQFQV